MEQEVWKLIYNSKSYMISNYGRVKRLKHKRWNVKNNSWSIYKEIIKHIDYNNSKGYGRVDIRYKTYTKTEQVHRLVAKYFKVNPNISIYNQVNHLDGNKTNNYWRNLQWCTNQMNKQHAIKNDLISNGRNHSNITHLRKLTEEQVLQIPILLQTMTYIEVASLFNVSPGNILEIKAGRSWKHFNLDFNN